MDFFTKAIRSKLTIGILRNFSLLYRESVVMYRKVLLIFVAVVVRTLGVVIQALVVILLMLFFLFLNNSKRPYINRALNDLESTSLTAAIITFYTGIVFATARDPTSVSYDENTDFYITDFYQYFLFVIIIFSNLSFFLMWISQFYNMLKITFRRRYPKVYLYLFLCGRIDKLEGESMKFA